MTYSLAGDLENDLAIGLSWFDIVVVLMRSGA